MTRKCNPEFASKSGRRKNGQFLPGQTGNAKGRPPAMPLELRQRLTDASPEIIEGVISAASSGDMQAARLVLERIAPVTRPTAASVVIPELADAESLSDQAQAIVNTIARGDCPPDIGTTMIQAVAACAKIIEIDELERRLTALENSHQ
ncbi:MAG: DUF5681 domain-containing protein [Pseudomonadota bacterium]